MTKAEQIEEAIHKSILMQVQAYNNENMNNQIKVTDARKEVVRVLDWALADVDNNE